MIVRGSALFVERCRAAASGARVEVVSLRAAPLAVREWHPDVVVVPEELHGEAAAALRAQGAAVLELANDPAPEAVAALRELLCPGGASAV